MIVSLACMAVVSALMVIGAIYAASIALSPVILLAQWVYERGQS
jgi:hypothetical protein